MKLFSLPDGTINRKDRAQWLTMPFDLAFAITTVIPGPYCIDASQAYLAGSRESDFIAVGARSSQAYRPGSIAFDAIEVGSRASQGLVPGSQEGEYI